MDFSDKMCDTEQEHVQNEVISPGHTAQAAQAEFDWKNKCFICTGSCSRGYKNGRHGWSTVQSNISSDTQSLFTKVMEAAKARNDNNMINRLLTVPDNNLVSISARYHRFKNCVPHYLDKQKILQLNSSSVIVESLNQTAMQKLIKEFTTPILEKREVHQLKTLLARFQQIARQLGLEDSASVSYMHNMTRFKGSLIEHWDQVDFVSNKGCSDLIFPKDMTVQEALRKAEKLNAVLTSITEDQEIMFGEAKENNQTEESTVHAAIGILKSRIKRNTCKPHGEFFSPTEVSFDSAKEFLEPLLLKAVVWLYSDREYANAGEPEKVETKCLSLASDITALCTNSFAPKQLGLTVTVYQKTGSKNIIELLHRLGHGISYKDLRLFLTSAAEFASSLRQRLPSGALIPPELPEKKDGGQLILAAGDNWDHNEKTVDGKGTTHAMTSILLTPRVEEDRLFPRIPHASSRSLKLPGGSLSQVIHYQKPDQRPEPVFTPQPTFDEIQPLWDSKHVRRGLLTEIIYNVSRHLPDEESPPGPPWDAYHVQLSKHQDSVPLSTVAYNPILMAPPTDYSTIYTTMVRCKEMSAHLGHDYIPIFFDMGLLNKALEITWTQPERLRGVIPCVGGMHFLLSVMAGIGHLYGGAGILHLLRDSGVFAANTANNIIAGKDFSRCVYAMKLVDEVLQSLFFKQFQMWADENEAEIHPKIHQNLAALQENKSQPADTTNEEMREELENIVEEELLPLIDEFREEGRKTSSTFKLWDEYLQKVSTPLKMFIAATRSGNWEAYLSAMAQLLPLLFAADRTTYARYMPVLLVAMKRLPQEVLEAFQKTLFTAKLSEGTFNGVWIDYALETTQNKDLKGPGGIIGLTIKGPALERWFLSRPVTAQYGHSFLDFNRQSNAESHHLQKSRTNRWNKDKLQMLEMFDSGTFANPFASKETTSGLIHFATHEKASDEIKDSLVSALYLGNQMAQAFVEERLERKTKSFFDAMKRAAVKTMTNDKRNIKKKNMKTNIIPGETMYLRLMAINTKKKIPLERVMKYENTQVPLSLFNADATMLTPKKSVFLQKLETLLPASVITKPAVPAEAVLLDGMAVLHKLHIQKGTTYKDVADMFIDYVLRISRSNTTEHVLQIHVVFDRYNSSSTKEAARKKRGGTASAVSYHVAPEARTPKDWQQFLCNSENKENFAKYITEVAKTAEDKLHIGEYLIMSASEEDCIMVPPGNYPLKDLCSNHEEADVRLILHAIWAAKNGARTVAVISPDTDVFVLLCHHRNTIPATEIYFITGCEGKHTTKRRAIPVDQLCSALTEQQKAVLLPIYCLSGCDTVSAMHGHGKATAFKILVQESGKFQDLASLGNMTSVSDKERKACVVFAARMYGHNSNTLNAVRCVMAGKPGKNVTSKNMPPTDDAFNQHILRAHHQLVLWKHAHLPVIEIPDPTTCGFHLSQTTGELLPTMTTQPASAPELSNSMCCKCKDGICDTDCSCAVCEQPCTVECICKAILPGESDDEAIWCINDYTLSAACSDIFLPSDFEDSSI